MVERLPLTGGSVAQNDIKVSTYALLGPMVDWYLNPKEGFHLLAAFGAARLQMTGESGDVKPNNPVGGGGVVGAGYEWWMGDQWSVGVLGRLSASKMKDSSADINHTWSSFSSAATATYN